MSTHCNRYPECGCHPTVGTQCGLPETLLKALAQEPETAWLEYNGNPAPILITPGEAKPKKPHRKHGSNYTPPKRRHRK